MTFLKELEEKTYKIQNRILLARYRGKTFCPECSGGRLRKEALYVKVGGKNIAELTQISLDKLQAIFHNLELNDYDKSVSKTNTIRACQSIKGDE